MKTAAGPGPRVSDSVSLAWDLRSCIFHMFSGDVEAVDTETAL